MVIFNGTFPGLGEEPAVVAAAVDMLNDSASKGMHAHNRRLLVSPPSRVIDFSPSFDEGPA